MEYKTFLQEQDIIEASFKLGVDIFNAEYYPTFIVGLWRGGSTVGIYLQECLQSLGVITNHIAIRTSYVGPRRYAEDLAKSNLPIRVHSTEYLIKTLRAEDRLLIVDDVFGSGRNVAAVIDQLKRRLRRNFPEHLRVACLFQRTSQHQGSFQPDFVGAETNNWLILPYELQDLSYDELALHKPAVIDLIETYGLTLPKLS